MNKEQLIKQIDEFMELNRQCRQDGNDILNRVRGVLTKKNSDDYEKGLNDAWELAQIIGGTSHPGFYDIDELNDIFGWDDTADIFDHFSYAEALAKVQEYEKKKEEEMNKLTPGDVVEVHNMTYGDCKAIFVKYEDDDIILFRRKGGSFRLIGKNNWDIVKTDKHIDISGLVEVLYD